MTQGQTQGQPNAPDENLGATKVPQSAGDQLEELQESLPSPSPTQERARVALEILEGRKLDDISVRNIESINLNESPERQIDKLKHLYGASVLLVALLVKKGMLEKSFTLHDLDSVNVAGIDLSTEQRAALFKLKEISKDPNSKIGVFWREFVMDKMQESVGLVSVSADAAIDVVTGSDNSPADGSPENEKSIYERTKEFVSAHKIASAGMLLAGALGTAWLVSKVVKGVREDGAAGGAKAAGNTLKNWFLGGVAIAGGVFVAGQVLGLESIQKWLEKKGLSVKDSRVIQALILFADFDFLEGITTLRKGVREDIKNDLHKGYMQEFGLQEGVSIWVCEDENFKSFMEHDYADGLSIAAGNLASIPVLGWMFKNKRQVNDEIKLQAGMRNFMALIKQHAGWEGMTIHEVLNMMQHEILYNEDSYLTEIYTSEEERAELGRLREEQVEQPSEEFDSVLDSVDPKKGVTTKQKEYLLLALGEEEGLLADLNYMEEQIPIWYRRIAHGFNDVVIGAASLSGKGEAEAFEALGPDLADDGEFFDQEASLAQLEQFFQEIGVKDMELVSELIVETRAFRTFIASLEPSKPMTEDQRGDFERWEKKFKGSNGYFKRIKTAKFKGNIKSYDDEKFKYDHWTKGQEMESVLDFGFYTFFGAPLDIVFSEDARTKDYLVAGALTAVPVEAVSRILGKGNITPVTWAVKSPWIIHRKGLGNLQYWNQRRYIRSVESALRKGAITRSQAVEMAKRLSKIHDQSHRAVISRMSFEQVERLQARSSDLLDQLGRKYGDDLLREASDTAEAAAAASATEPAAAGFTSGADEVAEVTILFRRVAKAGADDIDDLARLYAVSTNRTAEEAAGLIRAAAGDAGKVQTIVDEIVAGQRTAREAVAVLQGVDFTMELNELAVRIFQATGEGANNLARLYAASTGKPYSEALEIITKSSLTTNAHELAIEIIDGQAAARAAREAFVLSVTADKIMDVEQLMARITGTSLDDIGDLVQLYRTHTGGKYTTEMAEEIIRRAINEGDAYLVAYEIVEGQKISREIAVATEIGDTAKAGQIRTRLRNTIEFYRGLRESRQAATAAAKPIMDAFQDFGANGVTPTVARKIAERFPDIAERLAASKGSTGASQMDEVFEAFGITKGATGAERATQLASKVRLALRAQTALLVIGVPLDIFAIGMSLYRLEELEEIVLNAENSHIKAIYREKKLREWVNIGLSGTSLVVTVTGLSLNIVASTCGAEAAGALAGALGLSSSLSWTGVGLVVTGVILVASGVMYGWDKMDESRIEEAYEKDDWKMMPTPQLYKTWAMQVGVSDTETLLYSWRATKRSISESLPAAGLGQTILEEDQHRTSSEIVEALIERGLDIGMKIGEASVTKQSLAAYAKQYAVTMLGPEYNPGTMENGRRVIEESLVYAKMMVAREQIQIRRDFFERENVQAYLADTSPLASSQIRLTDAQIFVLPPMLSANYQTLVSLTPLVDLLPDDSVYIDNFEALPQSADVVLDRSKIGPVMEVFRSKSEAYLWEQLESENKIVFDNLQAMEPAVVLGKLNEMKMVHYLTGGLPPKMFKLMPILEKYIDYLGLVDAPQLSHPSVPALEKWAADVLSDHTMTQDVLKDQQGDYLRTDQEIMDQYSVSKNKFIYALYRLATDVFGYAGGSNEEAIKRFYSERNANVFGVYWDGSRWVVQEAGWESDNELSKESDVNYDRLYLELLEEFDAHKDDIFENTGELFFSAMGRNAKSQEIAEYYISVLKQAGEDYEKIAMNSAEFKQRATAYIMDHSKDGSYVVLPGYLLAQGVSSNVENLGQFAYRYEKDKVIAYRITADTTVKLPHVFDDELTQEVERFEVVPQADDYQRKMHEQVDEADALIHPIGNKQEFDLSEEVEAKLEKKRLEIDSFINSLGSFPPEEQASRLIDYYIEVAEFKRIVVLSILTKANEKTWSDDVDAETVDEDIETALRLRSDFRNSEMLHKHWQFLDRIWDRVNEGVSGKEYGVSYMRYFEQELSLIIAKSITLKFEEVSGKYDTQAWKSLDIKQLEHNLQGLMMYEDWVKEYKGIDVGPSSSVDRLDLEKEIIKALD